jgi:lysophospholipase L1-like esterase
MGCPIAAAGAVVVAVAMLAWGCEVRSRARAEPDAPRPLASLLSSQTSAQGDAAHPEAAVDASTASSSDESPRANGSDGPKPAPPEPQRHARRPCSIAAIGDSLTDFRSHGGGYLKLLQQECPQSRIDNYGRGGDMVNQMRRRLFEQVLGPGQPRYTHLIVFGGVNDLYSDLTAGRTVEKISRDLLAMYQAAHERGIRVVAITVAPWGGFSRYYNSRRGAATLALNEWVRRQTDSGSVDDVVDAYALLSCGDAQRLCDAYRAPFRDGLHFGPAGHRVLAEALFARVFHECL